MHTLILDKATQVILQSRYDTSTGSKMPIEDVFKFYCKDNGVDSASVEAIEIPFTEFFLEIGKQIYNKQTNSVEINPNWVEPARESTAGIPTTDTSTNTTVNG
jgi:hypothetical protein